MGLDVYERFTLRVGRCNYGGVVLGRTGTTIEADRAGE